MHCSILEQVYNITSPYNQTDKKCLIKRVRLQTEKISKTVLFRSGESSPGRTRTGTGNCLRRNGSESSTQPAARPPCESRPVLSTVFPSHHCLLII